MCTTPTFLIGYSPDVQPDPDLREYQRRMALSAIADRYSPKKLAPLRTERAPRKRGTRPLFDLSDEEFPQGITVGDLDEDDDALALAIQRSLDEPKETLASSPHASTSFARQDQQSSPVRPTPLLVPKKSFEAHVDTFESPTRLETALSFANTRPIHSLSSTFQASPGNLFGHPGLLKEPRHPINLETDSDEDMEEVVLPQDTGGDATTTIVVPVVPAEGSHRPPSKLVSGPASKIQAESRPDTISESFPGPLPEHPPKPLHEAPEDLTLQYTDSEAGDDLEVTGTKSTMAEARETTQEEVIPVATSNTVVQGAEGAQGHPRSPSPTTPPPVTSHEDEPIAWSRSPSPSGQPGQPGDVEDLPHKAVDWDAAHEMDPHAEEGEFARFISEVKGKDLDDVRKEIDDEIKFLNQQRKAAMRDSEDVTQQMITQIMVCPPFFCFQLKFVDRTPGHASSFWNSLHHSTDGSRSAVRRACVTWFSGRRHHR